MNAEMVLTAAGGVGLFLYGMFRMGDGLEGGRRPDEAHP